MAKRKPPAGWYAENFGQWGTVDTEGVPPLPDQPTLAIPGTPEKISVMEERAAACRQLKHPGDASMDQDGTIRVPILTPGNFKLLGWEIFGEAEFRRRLAEEGEEPADGISRRYVYFLGSPAAKEALNGEDW